MQCEKSASTFSFVSCSSITKALSSSHPLHTSEPHDPCHTHLPCISRWLFFHRLIVDDVIWKAFVVHKIFRRRRPSHLKWLSVTLSKKHTLSKSSANTLKLSTPSPLFALSCVLCCFFSFAFQITEAHKYQRLYFLELLRYCRHALLRSCSPMLLRSYIYMVLWSHTHALSSLCDFNLTRSSAHKRI